MARISSQNAWSKWKGEYLQRKANELREMMNTKTKEEIRKIRQKKYFEWVDVFKSAQNFLTIATGDNGVINTNTVDKNIYAAAFIFADKFNKWRGEKDTSYLIVVHIVNEQQEDEIAVYELNSAENFLSLYSGGKITGDNVALKERLEALNAKDISRDSETIISAHQIRAQQAYAGAMKRLRRYREVAHLTTGREEGYVLWKVWDEWSIAYVQSGGVLKEAYAHALFAKHKEKSVEDILCFLSPGNPPYYGDTLIKYFFKLYVKKVTTTAAIYEEDVITSDKQYAVKGSAASLPGLQQYVDMAQWAVKQGYLDPTQTALLEAFEQSSASVSEKSLGPILDACDNRIETAVRKILGESFDNDLWGNEDTKDRVFEQAANIVYSN